MAHYLELAKRGFMFNYNGAPSKWGIRIDSMVPARSRVSIDDYYIIVHKEGANIDRYFTKEGFLSSVYNIDIPNYVRDTVADLLDTGDINKYLNGKEIDNKFIRIGTAL